ncbi:MAG: hypothetical protein ACRD12_23365 [Acidimicrobiales bacterium]
MMLPYGWLERRLFEVLGGWVPTTPEPDVKLMLRRHSFEHARHGELWAGLCPEAVPPTEELARLIDTVAAPDGTGERLAGAYGVLLPALVSSYRAGAGQTAADAGAGGPVARVLRLVLADDEPALAEGMAALGRWEEHEEARRHRATVEELVAISGL